MNNKPYILVSNDDGIDAPGIKELALQMSYLGDVVVAAPDRQNSAVSSSLSVAKPLRVKRYEENNIKYFSIDGTPTDTVKIAIFELLDKKPDLVVSGINHGANTSVNVLYSGTVGAAIEGVLAGIPSIAFSIASHSYQTNLEDAGKYVRIIAEHILKSSIPMGTLINVNIPALNPGEIKGIKATHLSKSKWYDKYEKRFDPFDREYFWFAGEYIMLEDESEDADDKAVVDGFVSVTPVKFEFTDKDYLEKLKKMSIFD